MPNITISPIERKKITDLYREFLVINDNKNDREKITQIIAFLQKYADKICIDDEGSLTIKRTITTIKNGLREIKYQGIDDIQHSYIFTQDSKIIAFGRKDEGAVLGSGAFGVVREGISFIDLDSYEQNAGSTVALKAVSRADTLINETNALRQLGRLQGTGKFVYGPRSRHYLVDKKIPGSELARLTEPKASLKQTLESVLARERAEGKTELTDGTLLKAIFEYKNIHGHSPLEWREEIKERQDIRVIEGKEVKGRKYREHFEPWAQFLRNPGLQAFGNGLTPAELYPIICQDPKLFESLKNIVIKERSDIEKKLSQQIPSLTQRLAIAFASTQAVKRFHDSGQLHNDIKGANILGGVEETKGIILATAELVDFGTRLELTEGFTTVQHVGRMGTPGYWAPEVDVNTGSTFSKASDIYSLAVTFERDFGLGEVAVELIKKMKETNPEKRPTSEQILKEIVIAYKNYYQVFYTDEMETLEALNDPNSFDTMNDEFKAYYIEYKKILESYTVAWNKQEDISITELESLRTEIVKHKEKLALSIEFNAVPARRKRNPNSVVDPVRSVVTNLYGNSEGRNQPEIPGARNSNPDDDSGQSHETKPT